MNVTTPENGSTWLHDAALDTTEFLNATIGDDVSDAMYDAIPEDRHPSWDGPILTDSGAEIASYLSTLEGTEYIQVDRCNVYNHENDFSDVFTYTAYAPKDALKQCGGEWFYTDGVYVATCKHLGGDVRGNYAGPELRKGDCLAESGFLDWMVGWTVEGPGLELDDSEEFSPGYSANPGCHMVEKYGDDGEWQEGEFHFHNSDGERTGIKAIPYSYAGGC